MAPLARMSKQWTAASAQLPQRWQISGVVMGPRVADAAIEGETWTAWATGDDERVERHGDTPEDAMADLANNLRAIRPNPNG